jgi:osmoprotectant transport system permease protein
MSIIGGAFSWLGDGSTWTGDSGLLHLGAQHLEITVEAMALSLVVGIPLGLVLGHAHKGGGFVTLLSNLARAIPTLALLILLTKWAAFGVSKKTAVVALALFALPPILTNTFTGTDGVDRDTVDASRGLGMTGRQIRLGVELPLALPLMAAGIRSAAVQTFATATLASFLGTPTLGSPIQIGDSLQMYDQVLGAAIVIAVVALLIDLILGRVQAVLTPGIPGSVWHRILPVTFGGASASRGATIVPAATEGVGTAL